MGHRKEKDEYLENLWYMREHQTEVLTELQAKMNGQYVQERMDELVSEGLVDLDLAGGKVRLSVEGEKHARRLVRAHRLAERLIHDAFGDNFESGACEFEHIMNLEIIDSICTVLGHPKECPHGLPIPPGDCCTRSAEMAHSAVIPLTKLKIGEEARIAYVNCANDERLHKIDTLQIRPGSVIKLQQTYPTYVVECEGTHVALGEELASSISVWRSSDSSVDASAASSAGVGYGRRQGKGRGWGHGLRRRLGLCRKEN
ncbi:MAG: metal-dependent transcriptional regulator [Candidatus Omnitrophica bacterium]|nr:metal-dependent transcriptional regulator [Candidatus Omnitrophota bacterium]